MARTFTQNGVTYSDAPAGWLKAHKDEWDGKLRAKGHLPRWHKNANNSYEADCTRCRGNMSCGTWGSTSNSRIDLRKTRCEPVRRS